MDDETSARDLCYDIAIEAGLRATGVASTEEALEVIERRPVDVVVTDLQVPNMGGLALLKTIRQSHPHIMVMVLTQYGTIDSAVEATKLGAFDYVTKPFRVDDLRQKLQRVTHTLATVRESEVMREELRCLRGFGDLIGVSSPMEKIYTLIEKLSDQDCPVLILGESGTGKELVASSLHHLGPRKACPFVPVDCSALAPTLIESELFGHIRGAFTGAIQSKPGLLESADEGTIFLDEIAELPLDLQAKLLRAIQNRQVRAVGSNKFVTFNARIVAATNRDLEQAVQDGRFRQDLFFRLNVVQINVPPLRKRKSDIMLLATTFLERFSTPDEEPKSFSPDAIELMMAYSWPGNVRELENAVECAVALGSGPMVHAFDLPAHLHYPHNRIANSTEATLNVAELEKRAIYKALRESGGDKIVAARSLGIGKTTLYRKLKEYSQHT